VARQQAYVALLLGGALSAGGWLRVYLAAGSAADATAISVSLFAIVITSVMFGTAMPFALARAGVDPAHAGTTIQVVMDVLGVAVTCVTCDLVLERLSGALAGA